MSTDFLRRVYCAASSENSDPLDGDRLEELYEHMPEPRTALDVFDKRLAGLGVNLDGASVELYDLTDAYEMQGFLNGFRLGVAMANELNLPGLAAAGAASPTEGGGRDRERGGSSPLPHHHCGSSPRRVRRRPDVRSGRVRNPGGLPPGGLVPDCGASDEVPAAVKAAHRRQKGREHMTLEQIRAYIAQHNTPRPDLDELTLDEMSVLKDLASSEHIGSALHVAYEYGKAKGYQTGKAGREKGGAAQ